MDPRADAHWTQELLAESGWVRALAARLVADGTAAEDVVQETWVAALTRPPRTDRSLRPWLARVVRAQVALRRRGRTHRRDRELLAARPEPLPSADELAVRSEAHERLVRAVRALREPYRSAILLHFYEGLTAAEIARRGGEPGATVRSRIHRGLEHLRAELDADYGDRRRWCVALSPLLPRARARDAAAAARASFALRIGLVVGLVAGLGWALRAASREGAAVTPAERLSTERVGEALAGERAPVAAAAPRRPVAPPSATRRVRLVDERTGETLPDYEVAVLLPDGGSARARTDREGELELDVPGGALDLRLVDDPRLRDREAVVHDTRIRAPVPEVRLVLAAGAADGAADPIVQVPAGPTYALDLDPPAGLGLRDLSAHLRAGDTPAFDTRKWQMHVAPVREPGWVGAPWVRFAAVEGEFLRAGPPWMLQVASADGFWAGATPVESITGRYTGRVRVELSPRARLSGRVTDAAGPVTRDVLLHLLEADGSSTQRRTDTDGGGRYALGGLAPGDYRLVVDCPRHVTAEVELSIPGGVETTCDVELVAAAAGGTVEGILTSRTGTYDGSAVLVLASAEVASRRFFASARWQARDGRFVSPFRFEDVPRGRYELEVFALDDRLPWRPAVLALEAPATEVRLECLDDAECAALTVLAADARTGEPIDGYGIRYAVDGGTPVALDQVRPRGSTPGEEVFEWRVGFAGVVWGLRSGPAQIPCVPRDSELRWLVHADGRVPARGDESAFVEEESAGGVRRWIARVPLERGWGVRVRVVGDDGHPVPQGAELWADGERVAVDGGDGVLECRLDAAPVELEVRSGGARLPLDPAAAPRLDGTVRLDR